MREIESPSVANLDSNYHSALVDRSFDVDPALAGGDAPGDVHRETPRDTATDGDCLSIRVGTALADVERQMITATLKFCGGNKTHAAAVLGVSLKTLYNRLNEYRATSVGEGGSSFPMSCVR